MVQASAKVRYAIRSRDLPGMFALNERVKKIAEGAALMTETKVAISIVSAVSNKLGNTPLEGAMYDAMRRLGPVPFSAADRAFAAEIQKTLSEEDIHSDYLRVGLPMRKDTPLCDFIVPIDVRGEPMIGSTDVADVSWVVPTVEARHARPFVAARRAGQVGGGAQRHGARGQDHGGDRHRRVDRHHTDRPCESRYPRADVDDALCLPDSTRGQSTAPAASSRPLTDEGPRGGRGGQSWPHCPRSKKEDRDHV